MKFQHITLFFFFLCSPGLFGQTEKEVEKAEKLNEKAQKKVEKGKKIKAIDLFSKSLTYNEENSYTYFLRGQVYLSLNEYEVAIEDFDRAISKNPSEGGFYWKRGACYIALEAFEFALADFESGEKRVQKLSLSEQESLVEAYLYTSRIGQALPYLNELIAQKPDEVHYYLQRTTCYLTLGQLREAHTDLRKLEELGDTSHERYKLETLFHMQTKNVAMAVESARKNIRSNDPVTVQAEGYQLLSNVYYSIQYRDSAMVNINRAIALDAQAAYHYDRGCYYADVEEFKAALEDFNTTISKDSTHIGAYNNRTFYSWFPAKEFENAVDDLSKIIALDSLNAYAYSNRSYAYFGLKEFDLAFNDAMASFELEPKNPYLYKNMALIYFAMGNEVEAQSMIQNALDWGFPAQTDPEFLFLLDYFKIPSP